MEDWDGFGSLQQKESAEMILSILIASCVQGAAVPAVPAQKMKWMTEENSGEQSETLTIMKPKKVWVVVVMRKETGKKGKNGTKEACTICKEWSLCFYIVFEI